MTIPTTRNPTFDQVFAGCRTQEQSDSSHHSEGTLGRPLHGQGTRQRVRFVTDEGSPSTRTAWKELPIGRKGLHSAALCCPAGGEGEKGALVPPFDRAVADGLLRVAAGVSARAGGRVALGARVRAVLLPAHVDRGLLTTAFATAATRLRSVFRFRTWHVNLPRRSVSITFEHNRCHEAGVVESRSPAPESGDP